MRTALLRSMVLGPMTFAVLLAGCVAAQAQASAPKSAEAPAQPAGVLLAHLAWDEAEKVLTPETVVVIPLGAEAKEHGLHLPLNNDYLMAEYFQQRVLEASHVVVAPTVNYSFYPAFLEYPGSTSLRLETARDMIVDIAHTLANYGPRRFYALNTGISTLRPLAEAAKMLAEEGILLRYTDLTRPDPVEAKLRQSGGTHADEIETSMMLYIAPDVVNLARAKRDLGEDALGGLTRKKGGPGTYSPTGAWGDPTLATCEKGRQVVENLVTVILKDIETLRAEALPKRAEKAR